MLCLCFFSHSNRLAYGTFRCFEQILLQYCVNRLALYDYKHFCLLFASCAPFDSLVPRFFRKPYGKECLVKLHLVRELVYRILFSHDVPQLRHHKPYGRVLLYSQLMLDLFCGKYLLDGCHEMHGIKLSAKRQLAMLHHCSFGQWYATAAFHALEHFSSLQPLPGHVATTGAGNSLNDTHVTEIRHA